MAGGELGTSSGLMVSPARAIPKRDNHSICNGRVLRRCHGSNPFGVPLDASVDHTSITPTHWASSRGIDRVRPPAVEYRRTPGPPKRGPVNLRVYPFTAVGTGAILRRLLQRRYERLPAGPAGVMGPGPRRRSSGDLNVR
jgi:hypothetical protein